MSDKFEITRRAPDEAMPLSYEQEQVWLHAQLATNLPLYNEPGTIRFLGALDVSALEKSFNEILRRHEAWRTCFEIVDGVPVQKVQPSLKVSLPVLDLRALPAERRESEALRIATEDARKPIDLTKAPLFRTRLMRLENEEYRLYLTLSHIIFDGFAIYRVLLPELSTLYESFAAGRQSPLPELSIQYADYACWQRRNITEETLAKDLDYWKRELAGPLPESYLPVDRQRVGPQTFCGATYPFQLSSRLNSALIALSRSQGVTLYQILLAGFAALLSRYSGEPIIPIGSLTAGRKLHETQSLLGYFVNTVVLRLELSGDPSFRDLVKRVRNVALGALEHDNLPFEHLVREMRTTRDSSHNPLFQALFSLAPPPLPNLDPAWQMTLTEVDTGVSKYDLHFEIDQRGDEILPRFHYSTDLFDPATIARMANHWMNLLEGAAGSPDLRVSQLPLLSGQEKEQLIVEWNDTDADYPRDKSIPQQFAAQCERTPHIVAVREGNQQLTFCQLDERSDSLAEYLRNLGAGPGTTVGLCIERSIDMVAGLLGILKTGAAYVPLDPSYPMERLGFMLKDSGAAIVIAQRKSAGRIPANSARAVWLDSNWSAISAEPTDSPSLNSPSLNSPSLNSPSPDSPRSVRPTSSQPDDTAYVLYTSGSTGTPKGVQGTHRAYLNRFAWMWRAYPFQAGEVCCQKTNLGFVDSVWEIFGPLLAGVPNVIIPQEIIGDPEELLATLAREQVTRIVLVPSLLRVLLDHAPQLGKRVPQLKLWTCSGEVLPTDLAERFLAGFPEATLLNLYGSAEVAADVTYHEVSHKDLLAGSIPIGRPIANTQVYILDGNRNPVPVGVRGEIYVGGDNLARGYWRSPELTAERFVENSIAPERSPRLFRTGDLGRFKSTGEIEYLGRVDNQVKLRGMRLELGEVEAALSGHPAVRQAVVALTPDQQHLAAYITAENGQEPSAEELRRYLRARLPEYMVPASYSRLQQWPLLPSGKVDRRALPQLGHAESVQQSVFVAPHDAVEDQLLTIWKGILNLDAISVTDNFFSIGGYSLASARLLARIQQTFGRKLGLRDVFEAPTIAEMAELIRREGKSSDMQGILPLQPNGSLPPFFWVRGGPLFLPLSRRLGPERPSFGLQLSSSLVSKLPATYKFEDIASSLIQVMRAVRPNGPYYLGGLCVNGVVAYEMARQLVAAGESVPLLVMLDSQNPTYYFDYSPDGRTSFLYQKLKFHLGKLAKLRRTGLRHYIQERSADLQRRWNQRMWNNVYQRGNRLPEDQLGDMGSLVHPAAMKYQPQPYGGRVMFFQSADWPKGGYWKFQRGWPGFVRGLMEVHTIDAEHEEMLHDPNVDGISGPILSYLADAGKANYAPINSDATLAGRS
ncbi:MAG: amino acid adenylation domain-containing protein [Candidatus Sulfotelmatobacter sp.]